MPWAITCWRFAMELSCLAVQWQVLAVLLSTVYTPMWIENMVAGRGWIAIALVVLLHGNQRV